jgi:hypothetical protein
MQEVGRMRVDLANMARMAATACLEVGTISRIFKLVIFPVLIKKSMFRIGFIEIWIRNAGYL